MTDSPPDPKFFVDIHPEVMRRVGNGRFGAASQRSATPWRGRCAFVLGPIGRWVCVSAAAKFNQTGTLAGIRGYCGGQRHCSHHLFHQRREPLGRDQAVAAPDQPVDLVPVRPVVEPDPDPALVADIRGHEEALGVGADQHLLAALRRLAPERDAAVAALLHGEDLVPHPEGRVAPRLLLHRFGQSEAKGAQAVDRLVRHGPSVAGAGPARKAGRRGGRLGTPKRERFPFPAAARG